MPELNCPGCNKKEDFPLLRKLTHGCGMTFRCEQGPKGYIITTFSSVQPDGLGAKLGIGTRNSPNAGTPSQSTSTPTSTQKNEALDRKAADDAKRKAEAERKEAEEAKRKAAEEARIKAEAERKAAEEAKRKSEEDARRRQEEADRKAAEEARRRADEDARIKAQAAAVKPSTVDYKGQFEALVKSITAVGQELVDKKINTKFYMNKFLPEQIEIARGNYQKVSPASGVETLQKVLDQLKAKLPSGAQPAEVKSTQPETPPVVQETKRPAPEQKPVTGTKAPVREQPAASAETERKAAADEAKRNAEADRKAQEEARRKAEEARIKAEAERKAAEEAQRKADEDARVKAEAERKAAEEARAKAAAATVVPTATDTKTATRTRQNEDIKKSIEDLDSAVAKGKVADKRKLVKEAVDSINAQQPKDLADLPVLDQIKLIKQVQIPAEPDGKLTADQKKALSKIFRSIKMEKEFQEHDKAARKDILESLVKETELTKARDNWNKTTVLGADKKKAIKKAQDLQCARLGFTPDPIQYASLDDNQYGVCSGKTVKISTEPKCANDFNEMMDTIIHETTHAYQDFLVDELNDGKLKTDDPRYAQAWLFKLNKGQAYLDAPPTISDADRKIPARKKAYDEAYAGYKDQPMELHAWKAGNEAGRAFDVNAVALELASLTATISALTPDAASQANDLVAKFQNKQSVMEGTEMIAEIDALATKAYDVANEQTKDLISPIGQFETGGYERYDAEWDTIANGKGKPRDKLKKMEALRVKLRRVTEEGKVAENAYTSAKDDANKLIPEIGSYVSGGYAKYVNEWKNIANSKDAIKQRLPLMEKLRDELARLTEQGQKDETEWNVLWDKLVCADNNALNEANRINRLATYGEKLKQLKTSAVLAESRKRSGIT